MDIETSGPPDYDDERSWRQVIQERLLEMLAPVICFCLWCIGAIRIKEPKDHQGNGDDGVA
jgi:hypothetical protein